MVAIQALLERPPASGFTSLPQQDFLALRRPRAEIQETHWAWTSPLLPNDHLCIQYLPADATLGLKFLQWDLGYALPY